MEEVGNVEPSPYGSPMFYLPMIVGFMFAGMIAFVFAYSNGWPSFLSLLFFSAGDASVSLLVAGIVFGMPIATIGAGFLLMPIAIAVTPSGIVYTTRLKREIFGWDSFLPATGVPSGAWAPFRFSSLTGSRIDFRWIDRVRAREIMRNPDVPPKFFPKVYWEWAGVEAPTSLPETAAPLRSGS
jgi:hypothetical protein